MNRQHKGKHYKEKNRNKKKIRFIYFFMLIIVIIGIVVAYKYYNNEDISSNKVFEEENIEEVKESSIEIVEEDFPEEMGRFKVLGKISIDSIGIEKYILDQTTDASLNLSVTKFFGPDINEPGNFVITGHNYKDIFAYVLNLKIGDTFYIVDKENSRKITYKVYNTFEVYPKELDCLSQETNGKREVTLITCEPGAVTRFIVKAREI